MAISTPTHLGSASSNTTTAGGTVTVPAGATCFAFLSQYNTSTVPVTGDMGCADNSAENNADTGTPDWVAVAFLDYDTGVNRRQAHKVFMKRFATGGSMTIQGTFTGANDCTIALESVVSDNGFDLPTNIATSTNSAGDPDATLPTTPIYNSLIMGLASTQGNNSYGAVTGFTELSDANWGTGAGNTRRGVAAYDMPAAGSTPVARYNPVSSNTYTGLILMELVEKIPLAGNGNDLLGSYDDTNAATTYTFEVALGPTAADRKNAFWLFGRDGGTTATLSAADLDGNALTLTVNERCTSTNNTMLAYGWLDTGTGSPLAAATRALLTVTYSEATSRANVDGYRLAGFGATYDSAFNNTNASGSPSLSGFDVPANGAVHAAWNIAASVDPGDLTWTNATERTERIAATSQRVSSASDNYVSSQTGLAISTARTSGTAQEQVLAAVSWSPTGGGGGGGQPPRTMHQFRLRMAA